LIFDKEAKVIQWNKESIFIYTLLQTIFFIRKKIILHVNPRSLSLGRYLHFIKCYETANTMGRRYKSMGEAKA
ncbi:hypothetical protein ACQP3D_28085, partial [Escherichia coli]